MDDYFDDLIKVDNYSDEQISRALELKLLSLKLMIVFSAAYYDFGDYLIRDFPEKFEVASLKVSRTVRDKKDSIEGTIAFHESRAALCALIGSLFNGWSKCYKNLAAHLRSQD